MGPPPTAKGKLDAKRPPLSFNANEQLSIRLHLQRHSRPEGAGAQLGVQCQGVEKTIAIFRESLQETSGWKAVGDCVTGLRRCGTEHW